MPTTFNLTFITSSPLMIDGQHSSLYVDKATSRRHKLPYIPASAIKGAMRIEFERLMRASDENVCMPIGKDPSAECTCIVCALFGPAGKSDEILRFSDALLKDQTGTFANAFETRTNVSISRSLHKAADGRLFNLSVTPRSLEFTSQIDVSEQVGNVKLQIFRRVMDWWRCEGITIGGNRSTGFGRLSLEYAEVGQSAHANLARAPETTNGQLYRMRVLPTVNGEPIRVSPQKVTNYLLKSLDFVPGSTVRGAAAGSLKRIGYGEDAVTEMITRRMTRFSHLYPTSELNHEGFTGINPATAVKCKKDDKHGPWDTLLLNWLLHLAQDNGNSEATANIATVLSKCPLCPSPLKPAEPWKPPVRQLMIKLGLSRSLAKSEDKYFYIYETLTDVKAFDGVVFMEEGLSEDLSKSTIYLGGARSKGFGANRVEFHPIGGDLGEKQGLQDRVTTLNDEISKLARKFKVTDPCEEKHYFTLNLLTDLALPPGTTIQQLMTDRRWTVESASLHWTRLGGFSEQSGQQKPLMSVLERGGVVLLSVPKAGVDEVKLIAELIDLEIKGLGLFRDQGFGWIQGCHSFHSNVLERRG